MKKQVLSLEQMKHLKKLGLDIKANMRWYRFCYNNGKEVVYDEWELALNKEDPWKNIHFPWRGYIEFIFTFTIQDILDLLPGTINNNDDEYWLEFGLSEPDKSVWYIQYKSVETISVLKYVLSNTSIDAAYEMLCWCIENGYVGTCCS